MSIAEQPDKTVSLVQRVKAILLRPRLTWEEIDAEPAQNRALLLGYAAPLAAIGVVCVAISEIVFGARGSLGLAYHPPLAETLGRAVFSWMFDIAMVFVFALALEFMSPVFGGIKDRKQALKLAVYTSTAGWLAGVFQILPRPYAALSIVGLYSFWLLHLGLPRLMKVEGDRALVFTVCGIVAAMGAFFLGQVLTAAAMTPVFFLTKGFAS